MDEAIRSICDNHGGQEQETAAEHNAKQAAMSALHPEFASSYSALSDLRRPAAWPQGADIISKQLSKSKP